MKGPLVLCRWGASLGPHFFVIWYFDANNWILVLWIWWQILKLMVFRLFWKFCKNKLFKYIDKLRLFCLKMTFTSNSWWVTLTSMWVNVTMLDSNFCTFFTWHNFNPCYISKTTPLKLVVKIMFVNCGSNQNFSNCFGLIWTYWPAREDDSKTWPDSED